MTTLGTSYSMQEFFLAQAAPCLSVCKFYFKHGTGLPIHFLKGISKDG